MNYQVVLWKLKLKEDPTIEVPRVVLEYAFQHFVPCIEEEVVDR
jgi:hypothetical protein